MPPVVYVYTDTDGRRYDGTPIVDENGIEQIRFTLKPAGSDDPPPALPAHEPMTLFTTLAYAPSAWSVKTAAPAAPAAPAEAAAPEHPRLVEFGEILALPAAWRALLDEDDQQSVEDCEEAPDDGTDIDDPTPYRNDRRRVYSGWTPEGFRFYANLESDDYSYSLGVYVETDRPELAGSREEPRRMMILYNADDGPDWTFAWGEYAGEYCWGNGQATEFRAATIGLEAA